jgi:hypothetical protein
MPEGIIIPTGSHGLKNQHNHQETEGAKHRMIPNHLKFLNIIFTKFDETSLSLKIAWVTVFCNNHDRPSRNPLIVSYCHRLLPSINNNAAVICLLHQFDDHSRQINCCDRANNNQEYWQCLSYWSVCS